MAKNDIPSYDATAANNTDVQSVDISENCSPAGINNAIREVMADLKNVDTGAVALTSPSASQLNVDNLRLDGNTISSTDTNGNITLDPNGTGDIVLDANVGIGTAAPAHEMHIQGSGTTASLSLKGSGTGTATSDGIELKLQGDNSAYLYNYENAMLRFGTNGLERMRITSGGNVGIGTASPTVDGSLAGVTVPSGSRYLHVHDGDAAVLKLSDPATGANRGAQFGIINTTAILNNCESGNLLIGQGNAEVARFHQGGVCSFGTTTANYTTTQGFVVVPASNGYIANGHASGTANGTSYQLFSLAGTAIGSVSQASSSSVAYNTTSDYRRKTAVSYDWDATTRLKQLKPCRFKWISEGDTAPFVDGFLAHEVSDTVPEAITGEKDAMKDEEYVVTEAKGDIYTPATDDADEVIHSSNVERPMSLADGQAWRETAPQVTATRNVPDYQQIDQSKLVPLLVKTIQELEARIAALEA